MIVDLPAPFSPTTAWISPGEIPNDTSFTAVMPPKRFVTRSSRMMPSNEADSVKEYSCLVKSRLNACPGGTLDDRLRLRGCPCHPRVSQIVIRPCHGLEIRVVL